jgi:diketogulonate reductase-like aldo/keto reductase
MEVGFMPSERSSLTRRGVVAGLGAAPLLPGLAGADDAMITKAIPATGERIPAIGMGTWITFNVGEDAALRRDRLAILRTFFDRGGGLIDSSPMYGSSQAVVGWCLEQLDDTSGLLAADKIWTRFGDGAEQMAATRRRWGVERFDVVQVHNLLSWREHLPMLRRAKEAGRVRYIGVTTSHGRRHDELERVMRDEPLDFVQLTYNIVDRAAEDRLLPLAAERGIAVIANRPYRRKQLFRRYQDRPLPPWAEEVGARNWAEFFLKFIVSHPAVTCAIPATSQTVHMRENMGALQGRLPEARDRRRMVEWVERL